MFSPDMFTRLYALFNVPTCQIDCGQNCAPYNQKGIPFCCDIQHAIPTLYDEEWNYLQTKTNLWHPWRGKTDDETQQIQAETPSGLILAECLGHENCQRSYRSITCRAFPFFPYISSLNHIIGLTYYIEYRDRCWLINHLPFVNPEFCKVFIETYLSLFDIYPQEQEIFKSHSQHVRQIYLRQRRRIPIINTDREIYFLKPMNETKIKADISKLPKYGVYRLVAHLPFTDEL